VSDDEFDTEAGRKRVEALFDRINDSDLESAVLPMSDEDKENITRSPVVTVINPKTPELKVLFYKMYGKSPWWGIIVTNIKKRVFLTKLRIEDLERLIFNIKLERFEKMTSERRRLSVIGNSVVESEHGPFLTDGEIDFEKIHPGWVVQIGKDLGHEFFVPPGEEYVEEKLAAYERKYNKFCSWMVQQLT
jgi:hypothetical protein